MTELIIKKAHHKIGKSRRWRVTIAARTFSATGDILNYTALTLTLADAERVASLLGKAVRGKPRYRYYGKNVRAFEAGGRPLKLK